MGATTDPAQFVEVTTPASSNPFNALLNSHPSSTSTFQTFAKRLSPEGECKDTLSSQGSSSNDSRWPPSQSQSHSSRESNRSQPHHHHHQILSPMTPNGASAAAGCFPSSGRHAGGGGSSKSRKARLCKESKHYQESDILESPPAQYCASALSDKISDYEDVWSHDPSDRASLLTSFKPGLEQVPHGGAAAGGGGVMNRRPDLLAETRK